ncbi:uncharacterized protein K452DRAFT_169236 [Aplosporella prunicola CBS 121167]|uniref:P-loop containing nucleoside triphosphate hydrolase protein n=1 Tax=Aplosporella prunicola CBS 121167 TaxID=1176127 RepID=A0A6A6BJ38_9PEZI|nr:uncharacterized protein K452DRAFT_169236 [Aplosporella prunicola CBS 121167]KAF2143325.1 hypothetical protein K452DRAFT_169236 [Aplosporella prunicola CBS 121167]
MSNKPIFAATHPRACSTAFERVFMTRRDTLQSVHEPFGDAFYYGPERLSERYANDEKARIKSGFSDSTYKTILDRIDRENTEGKRIFIKDMAYYLLSPDQKPTSLAPSLLNYKRGVGTDGVAGATTNGANGANGVNGTNGVSDTNGANGHADTVKTIPVESPPYPYPTEREEGNPTLVPLELLKKFHWTFLIRHPRNSIPSYYRCTIPPLDEVTGFYNYMPSEAGYEELRRFFDYLKSIGMIGPKISGQDGLADNEGVTPPPGAEQVEICVIDADDLLDDPVGIISTYCKSVGIEYGDDMLNWDNEEDHDFAREAFEKWKGFHEDAIDSKDLKPRAQIPKPDAELYAEWVEKFGEEGASVIRATVAQNVADYEYLKQFAMKTPKTMEQA